MTQTPQYQCKRCKALTTNSSGKCPDKYCGGTTKKV